MNEVERFIRHFNNNDGTVKTFTCGCCYWFAVILLIRFGNRDAKIMYDRRINHFATMIEGRVYDITGDVTDEYEWDLWDDVRLIDELDTKHIIRDCINFTYVK